MLGSLHTDSRSRRLSLQDSHPSLHRSGVSFKALFDKLLPDRFSIPEISSFILQGFKGRLFMGFFNSQRKSVCLRIDVILLNKIHARKSSRIHFFPPNPLGHSTLDWHVCTFFSISIDFIYRLHLLK